MSLSVHCPLSIALSLEFIDHYEDGWMKMICLIIDEQTIQKISFQHELQNLLCVKIPRLYIGVRRNKVLPVALKQSSIGWFILFNDDVGMIHWNQNHEQCSISNGGCLRKEDIRMINIGLGGAGGVILVELKIIVSQPRLYTWSWQKRKPNILFLCFLLTFTPEEQCSRKPPGAWKRYYSLKNQWAVTDVGHQLSEDEQIIFVVVSF